ncbi:Uncharacterised protein [Kingella potus]|uniref:Uncharacterized protein n=1 Tax=Kingella potus TaxID=265175 RepID=A0A377R1X0_9NEIS|nr:hypothetical protein [Kingella potus]STR02496.1 Uncharacterised protein [Kingella potus]
MNFKRIKKKYFIGIGLLFAALCLGGILIRPSETDVYEYWDDLLAKDAKPWFVSEQEYKAKNRAGFCWRDKKFYTPAELKNKAVASFGEIWISEMETFRSRNPPNEINGGTFDSVRQCRYSQFGCRVWFFPGKRTNQEWLDRFKELKKIASPDNFYTFEEKYLFSQGEKQAGSKKELEEYIEKSGKDGFSLVQNTLETKHMLASDCCSVLPKNEAVQKLESKDNIGLDEDLHLLHFYHQSSIPENIDLQDYGVGNFYFHAHEINSFVRRTLADKDYLAGINEWPYDEIYFMNNCGDVLRHPHYVLRRKN